MIKKIIADEAPPDDGMAEMEATKDIFDCGDGDPWWLWLIAAAAFTGLCGGFFWSLVTIADYLRNFA